MTNTFAYKKKKGGLEISQPERLEATGFSYANFHKITYQRNLLGNLDISLHPRKRASSWEQKRVWKNRGTHSWIL